ncbi:TonB-dependent receptor [Enterovirga rhinocerotis]|nr:TonB-dependent receptor [Enterovirga rhinocerotis]
MAALLVSTSAFAQATLDPGPSPSTALPPLVVEEPVARTRPASPRGARAAPRARAAARPAAAADSQARSGAGLVRPRVVSPVAPLNEISVAAAKRPQELGKTDAAVSVVHGAVLRDRQVQTTADLQKVLPGLVVDDRGSGLFANFTVRGINSFDFYNPSVQVLIDGVPQSARALVQDLSNVGRVEFLRGPQGTLFGINAFAGVISISTEKPRENRASISAIASNGLYEIGANTTTVLVPDTLFLDLGIKERHYIGQLKDLERGKDNIDGRNALSGRMALRYAPLGGDFDAMLSASHESLRSREENFVLDADLRRRWFRSTPQRYYNSFDRELTTTALAWNYRMGDFTLSSVSSFQYIDLRRRAVVDQPETYRTIYQELRLAYDGAGPLKGVAGVSFVNNDFTRGWPSIPVYYMGPSRNRVESSSASAFGEATYNLTNRLALTAGLRASYDWSDIDYLRPDSFGSGMGLASKQEANFSNVQPKVSLGYQVNDTTRVYALVSQGYKAGGFNHTVSSSFDLNVYKPETAWNFEVGGRTELFDGRLGLSAALYHISSQDQQVYVGPIGYQVLRNAGQGVSTGVELEARLQATDQLVLTAQGAFGRSEFDKFTDWQKGVNYKGKRIPYAPDVTANLGARYTIEQTLIPAQVTLTGNMRIIGKTFFDMENTLAQGGYTTYDAGLEFAFPNQVTAKIFANNLTDKVYRTYSYQSGPSVYSSVGMGRLVGLDVRMRF